MAKQMDFMDKFRKVVAVMLAAAMAAAVIIPMLLAISSL